jgi:hypothetical protein
MFPTPYFSQLRRENEIEEFFEIRHVVNRSYTELSPEIQKDLDGNKKIKLGKDDIIDNYRLDSDKKLEYVIRSIKNSKVSKDEEILLRIPIEDKKIEKIIDMHEKDIKKLENTTKTEDLENLSFALN